MTAANMVFEAYPGADAGKPARFLDRFTNLVFVLACLPNINALPFVGSVNNQPIAALLVLGYLVLRFGNVRADRGFAWLTGILAALCVVYTVLFLAARSDVAYITPVPGFMTYPMGTFRLLLNGFAYLVGPLICLFLLANLKRVSMHVLGWLIGIQVLVVLVQVSGIGAIQALFGTVLDPIMIGYNPGVLTGLGRGAAGTYVEPSHLGRYAIVFLLLVAVHRGPGSWPRLRAFCLLGSGMLLLFSQSLSGVMFLGLGAAFAGVWGMVQLKGRASALSIAAVVAVGLAIALAPAQSRLTDAVTKFVSVAAIGAEFNVLDLQIFGGVRLVNMVIGYRAVPVHPFGQGIGSSSQTMVDTAYQLGIPLLETNYWQAVATGREDNGGTTKPQGFGAQLSYDFGVFGVLWSLVFSIWALRRTLRRSNSAARATAGFLGWLMLLFYTTTTFPVPWLLLAIVGYIQDDRSDENGLDRKSVRLHA